MSSSPNKKIGTIFRGINADDDNPETTEIESTCMKCFNTGLTRLLFTKIPFYREVVLMSFNCDFCGYENNEIQSASEIQRKGIRIQLQVKTATDLNRRIVRSDYASICIPEVELEIPSQSQKGEITTVEGIVDRTIRGLLQDQQKRYAEHPDVANSLDAYIIRLNELKSLKASFTLILEDITGNSFIENPLAPTIDSNCRINYFDRSKMQNELLGLYDVHSLCNEEPTSESGWPLEEMHGEVLQFSTNCPQCLSPCETNMKLTNIPHFKEVIIMATVCNVCGNKTNEVKSGSGIEEKGVTFEVLVESNEDLTRDVLKSETCKLCIPDLDLEVGSSALGGRFTTVEGILVGIKDQLEGNDMFFQDSSDEASKQRLFDFVKTLEKVIRLEKPVTLVLDDPAGNSYVQSLGDGNNPDAKLKVNKYERSFNQNEELGLNDIKTENYSE